MKNDRAIENRFTRRGLLMALGLALPARALGKQAEVEPIRIGLCAPISGPDEAMGRSMRRGVELALALFQRQRPDIALSLQIADEGRSSNETTVAGEGLVRGGAVALIAAQTSVRTRVLLKVTEGYGVPLLMAISTNPVLTTLGTHSFRVCFSDPRQGDAMAELFRQRGIERIGILSDTRSDYSRALAMRLQQRFNGRMHQEFYSSMDVDLRAQWRQFRKAKIEALYMPGYYPDVARMAPALRALGFRGLLAGGDGWASSGIFDVEGAAEALEGAVFTDHFAADDPDSAGFVADWRAAYPGAGTDTPDALAALAHDAMRLLLKTVEKMSGEARVRLGRGEAAARAELLDRLASAELKDGATGGIRMGPDREPQKPVVLQEIRGGAFRFLQRIMHAQS